MDRTGFRHNLSHGFSPLQIMENSASWLCNVISKPIFHVAWFVKASLDQCVDLLLRGWSLDGSNAGIPPCSDFNIRRQPGSVDKTLDIDDCALVERSDPCRKRIHKP